MGIQLTPYKPKTRYHLQKCYGTNPRTRKSVGERHRWPDGPQTGCCAYCHRDVYQLRVKEFR